MTREALCAGLGLFGLLVSDALANAAERDTLELLVSCESSYPLMSIKWGDGDNTKAAETASIFLDIPSVTRQTIIEKAAECFSALKDDHSVIEINFDHLVLRCGIGPDVKKGRIVLGYAN